MPRLSLYEMIIRSQIDLKCNKYYLKEWITGTKILNVPDKRQCLVVVPNEFNKSFLQKMKKEKTKITEVTETDAKQYVKDFLFQARLPVYLMEYLQINNEYIFREPTVVKE